MAQEEPPQPKLAGRTRRVFLAQAALLCLIIVVAGWLRVDSHNWDDSQHINVDELSVSKATLKRVNIPTGSSLNTLFDPQNSPLNPRAGGALFVYGAFPLYIVKTVSSTLSAVTGDRYFSGLDGIEQTGRVIAGLLDTLVVAMVFLMGALLWGAWPGIIASGLYALAILPIQTSHFYISDPFMSTFMAATLLCSLLFYRKRRLWLLLLAGVCAGLAMACKLSAAPVLLLPLASALLITLAERGEKNGRAPWRRALSWGGIAVGGAALGLFVGDPFAILDASTFAAQISDQARINGGAIDEWFTRKYVGTWPVAHLWGQMILLGVGPLVGLAGTVGIGVVAGRAWRDRRWVGLLLLVGASAYFASIAFVEIKWDRYLMPLGPYLCLFATAFGLWGYELAGKRGRGFVVQGAVFAMLLLSALLGATAVSSIFRSEHTQVAASRWIYSNIPQGSHIGIEKTALAMPMPLSGYDVQKDWYQFVQMDPLEDKPSQEVADTFRTQLRDADYLVIDATQAAGTVPHLPWRYPVQIRYYSLLLSGQLGFSVALHSTSYPRIGGMEIPDDGGWVDLSFMDSSHPPIWVLTKERDLDEEEWAALFADAVRQPSVASRQKP